MSFLDNIFKNEKHDTITGLNNELKGIYIYNKFKKENKSIILVTSNLHEAGQIYNAINCHTSKVWFVPMDDFITSEAIAVSPEFKINRLEAINSIVSEEKSIIITNLMGYLRYLSPKNIFQKSKLTLKVNDTHKIEDLTNQLYNLGYKRQIMVNMTGEIAVRGFVLDIYPISSENPIRIEFWGDEIESIRTFDINSQLTIKEIKDITIYPNTERIIGKDEITNISGYLNNPITIYNNYQTLLKNYELLLEEIRNYSASMERDPNTKYMFSFDEVEDKESIKFEDIDEILNASTYKNVDIDNFPKGVEEINNILKKYLKNHKTVIICLENRYKVNKLLEFLGNDEIVYTNENEIIQGKINIISKKIYSGFNYENYVIITENELYGNKEEKGYKTKFQYGTRIKDITKLEIGDYVVHGIHGIGRYLGLKTIVKNGLKKDYLAIEYEKGDKLYIPVEKLDLITKYSSADTPVRKLSKLGSSDWQKTKAKARKRAEDIAEDLLKVYALRESKKGFAFNKDDKNQIEFEKEFPYQETADQLKVTEEIKKDMETQKPMDRLLCGDVGYGKTEVAFRAIFKAVNSKKQVALLCPTTILSSQHYNNAIKRFVNFNVKIALLNRFVTQKKVTEILNDLENGKIDLIIGTHRILSKDVKFKDLGLLVVDEEQRFGVKHKEKIKQYKENIDVLTLSATPIPRTLQMSMSGLRSLSLIETPPAQRYPIQTYVLKENNQIIKDAIYKELARNGQVFMLYNIVEDIENKKLELQKLIPEAKIGVAHGQMNKTELENVMSKFINKEYDVLLCTTIIETGIDIEAANTLIVLNSDHFGLSQLYQIRGRIGRSNKIAYCYLMYDNKKILSDIATKRLKVIKDFTELGSGFAIAMRDLSIRGAGDILGSEQAGFIDSIGIELFLQMVNEEIAKLQGKEVTEEKEDTKPLLDVSTTIESTYIPDEDLKIEIHKKISNIKSEEDLKQIKSELEDRFGKLSDELNIYMYEELFEATAQRLNITKIKQTKTFIEITLPREITKNINGDYLFYETSKLSRMFRFSMKENELIIILDIVKLDKHFIYYLIELLKIIDMSKKNTEN